MRNKNILSSTVSVLAGAALLGTLGWISAEKADAQAQAARKPLTESDRQVRAHAQRTIEEGMRIFRFDTFGSEAFWGDALQLHQALAGEKNGGAGGGCTPRPGWWVGLKVDAEALPAELVAGIKAGKVDLDDPATTLALLKLNAVVGVTGKFDPAGRIQSMGIQCAFCHSNVDDSFAPGIGKRLDGWANRDLNVGAIVSLAPNLKPFTDLLGGDGEESARERGARPLRRRARQGRQGASPGRQTGGDADPAGVRSCRGEPEYLDRLRLDAVLERLCRRDSDARHGHLLRQALRRQGSVSRGGEERRGEERLGRQHPGRVRLDHREAGCAALLSACDSCAEACGGQFRQDSRRAGERALRREGAVRELPRAAALYRARAQPAHARRDGRRFVPGRALADAHVPHRSARGPVDAPEGRLLSRRPLRHAPGCARALQRPLQARAERPGKSRADRVSEVAIADKDPPWPGSSSAFANNRTP